MAYSLKNYIAPSHYLRGDMDKNAHYFPSTIIFYDPNKN